MKSYLSRYDQERIVGEAIQLHFNCREGCTEWILERMGYILGFSVKPIPKFCKLASNLEKIVNAFDEVAGHLEIKPSKFRQIRYDMHREFQSEFQTEEPEPIPPIPPIRPSEPTPLEYKGPGSEHKGSRVS